MYNKLLVDELITKFGLDSTILFCEMESFKNSSLYEDCIKQPVNYRPSCVEFDYERDWWNNKRIELLKLKNSI